MMGQASRILPIGGTGVSMTLPPGRCASWETKCETERPDWMRGDDRQGVQAGGGHGLGGRGCGPDPGPVVQMDRRARLERDPEAEWTGTRGDRSEGRKWTLKASQAGCDGGQERRASRSCEEHTLNRCWMVHQLSQAPASLMRTIQEQGA